MQDCSCLHGHGQPWCSIFDSFLSGCVINALKINVLCLCMIHTGASAELPLVTNHTAIHYWAVAPTSTEFRPRSCSPGISFGVDWHLQPGLPGLLAQSLTSADDSFSLFVTPKKCSVPEFPRGSAYWRVCVERGLTWTCMPVARTSEQMACARQSVIYPLQKIK